MTSIYEYFSIIVQSIYSNYIVLVIFGSVLCPMDVLVQVLRPIEGFKSRKRFFVGYELY